MSRSVKNETRRKIVARPSGHGQNFGYSSTEPRESHRKFNRLVHAICSRPYMLSLSLFFCLHSPVVCMFFLQEEILLEINVISGVEG